MFKYILSRPVLASVISLLILISGLISITRLPVTRFPDIAPPSVSISVSYPGGNAETVAKSVLLPLEEAVNGVENMTYIKSSANNSGSGSISVFFKPGTDPDIAAVNVQNSISQAVNQIPAEVNEAGISVVKRQSGSIMTINIFSDKADGPYDETFLQAYARINVIREILRVEGVAQATLLGGRDYSMRIWLNPEKLAVYGLIPQEVISAIRQQNFEAAPGKFGEASYEVFEAVLKHKGRFSEPEEHECIPIRTNQDGSVLYLKDVARVEFGSSNYGSDNKVNARPGITINVSQTNNSNAKVIDQKVREVLENTARLFPEGISYDISYSVREQIDESIHQVIKTLFEAFILVFITVFIFLQNYRATLIPAVAIPVSLIGTFFFLDLMGFPINVLTMFALVLSIGIVVDDAIVVVEAVYHKMHSKKMKTYPATVEAMNEISKALISITLVMAAVFLPVGFLESPVGLFYRQFAYTLVAAVFISTINALTLSPVLCSLLLRPADEDTEGKSTFARYRDRLFKSFNYGFEAFTDRYTGIVRWTTAHKKMSLLGLAVVFLLTYLLFAVTPRSFIPTEDDSFLTYSLAMPSGSSLNRTTEAITQADRIIQKHAAVASVNSISGYNVIDGSTSPSFGMGYINLRPIAERQSIHRVIDDLRKQLGTVTDARISVFVRPTVQGFGDFDGIELVLQDRLGGEFSNFSQVADEFIREMNRLPQIKNAFTSFKADFPQYEITIDYLKAKALGVKNNKGEMIPINTLIRVNRVFGPEIVTRYNLFNGISIKASPAPGYSSGDAIAAVEKLAAQKIPASYNYEWTGISLEEKGAGSQTALIFALSIIFVYFLLSAQYESYIIPLAVLLSIPTGILGVFAFINLAGLENNIYVQVGLIMLIGLLAKNAILIVEYGIQSRKQGATALEAALTAARLRLRPIIMTSLAFVAGLIPLMVSVGPSAIGNKSVSISAAGGMLFGILLGLFIIPLLYLLFQVLHSWAEAGNKTITGRLSALPVFPVPFF